MGNAQEIRDPDRIRAVVLHLAHSALAISRDLQWIDHYYAIPMPRKNVVQRQPVVPGGFQPDEDASFQPFQLLHQEVQPGMGILDGKDRFVGLAVFIQQCHGMLALGHVDPAVEHSSTSCVQGKRGDLRQP
jgi:hypothetical protein